jgi:hypothetical protein
MDINVRYPMKIYKIEHPKFFGHPHEAANAPIVERFGLGGIFAQDGMSVSGWTTEMSARQYSSRKSRMTTRVAGSGRLGLTQRSW